jgi:serine/threonine protein kinase/Flp pilus assembly protein TadD
MSTELDAAESIFCNAIEIEQADERARFLLAACGNNAELKSQVDRLLNAHSRAGAFLNHPGPSSKETVAFECLEQVGHRVGNYKLLEQIGEGGMGIVFMADQVEPVRRRVALKITKPGMDSRQVIARFEAERQALAMMDHPNIAKILDAGTTSSGRPYFVMELVRGMSITEYCDKVRLPFRQRLEMVMAVCQAVQHAHTKGIIHRDLKPSNILVTLLDGVAVPRIIDFGIAKATLQTLTERTLFTGFGQMLGTPLYMSPEQTELSGMDVDTRSDVYSLGVLTYELLTGQTPFDKSRLMEAGYAEMQRIIKEEEPCRPSERISTLAAEARSTVADRRDVDQRQLSSHLRGELDWIVMKALEKDRSRRYASASALAEDMGRYLNGDPVEAGPPSSVYRVKKLLRRYQKQVALAGLLSLLILGLVSSSFRSWYLHCAAVQQSLVATRVSLDADSHEQAEAHLLQAKNLLGQSNATQELSLRAQRLSVELAERQKDREDYEQFNRHVEVGLSELSRSFGLDEEAKKALGVFNILTDEHWLGKLKQRHFTPAQVADISVQAYQSLLYIATRRAQVQRDWGWDAEDTQLFLDRAAAFHPKDKAFHYVQAIVYRNVGDPRAEAEQALYESTPAVTAWDHRFEARTNLNSTRSEYAELSYKLALQQQPDDFLSLVGLGQAVSYQDREPEAVQLYTGCIALRPHDPYGYVLRASSYQTLGEHDSAEADYTKAFEVCTTEYGRIMMIRFRRELYKATGQSDKWMRDTTQIIELLEPHVAERRSSTASFNHTINVTKFLVSFYRDAGRFEDALTLARANYEGLVARAGEKNPFSISVLSQLISCHESCGNYKEAAALAEKAVELERSSWGPDHLNTASSKEKLGAIYFSLGKFKEAHAVLNEVALKFETDLGGEHEATLRAMDQLSLVEMKLGHRAEAIQRWEKCYSVVGNSSKYTKTSDKVLVLASRLADAYVDQGQDERAILLLEDVLVAQAAPITLMTNSMQIFLSSLVDCYSEVGRHDEAIKYAEQLFSNTLIQTGTNSRDTRYAKRRLGFCYLAASQPDKALLILREYLAAGNKSETAFVYDQAHVARKLLAAGEYVAAESILLDCIATFQRVKPDDWQAFDARSMLGAVLIGLERFDEAEAFLISGHRGMLERDSKLSYDGRKRLAESARYLMQYYEAMNASEEALYCQN